MLALPAVWTRCNVRICPLLLGCSLAEQSWRACIMPGSDVKSLQQGPLGLSLHQIASFTLNISHFVCQRKLMSWMALLVWHRRNIKVKVGPSLKRSCSNAWTLSRVGRKAYEPDPSTANFAVSARRNQCNMGQTFDERSIISMCSTEHRSIREQ